MKPKYFFRKNMKNFNNLKSSEFSDFVDNSCLHMWKKFYDKDCVVCCIKIKQGQGMMDRRIIICIDNKNNEPFIFWRRHYLHYGEDFGNIKYYLSQRNFVIYWKDKEKFKQLQDILLIADI